MEPLNHALFFAAERRLSAMPSHHVQLPFRGGRCFCIAFRALKRPATLESPRGGNEASRAVTAMSNFLVEKILRMNKV